MALDVGRETDLLRPRDATTIHDIDCGAAVLIVAMGIVDVGLRLAEATRSIAHRRVGTAWAKTLRTGETLGDEAVASTHAIKFFDGIFTSRSVRFWVPAGIATLETYTSH